MNPSFAEDKFGCTFNAILISEYIGLWGLVNNAGISNVPGPIGWLNKRVYERIFQINYFGVVDVTITFLPLLKKARGRVVNIASALSRVSMGAGGYAETKYAVQSFSDTLR